MADLYKMLNTEENGRRRKVVALIGSAVAEGNIDYTAADLGIRAVEALQAENFEIIWLGHKP